MSPRDIAGELQRAVGNSGREASLIDLPQRIKVGGAIVADAELRPGDVRCCCQRPALKLIISATASTAKPLSTELSCLTALLLCFGEQLNEFLVDQRQGYGGQRNLL